ncbi:MAG: prepilin-type N-terminal cleavage/methylation domain-containing protein [Thermodesulfovibrionales bacterium]|nr:prepilin-type N-terminal cleavage/methylation domain-containing protein [Thermodesulfovibrionales bacterium]
MNTKGFTITEVVIVVAIIAILFAITISFQGWMRRYNVERTIREIHADLLRGRQIALSENRLVCVTLGTNSYVIKGDYSPVPDGDGDCDDQGDRIIVQRSLPYTLRNNFSNNTFNFQKDGLSNRMGHVRIEEQAYINCIDVFTTRINLGEWNGSQCIAK